MEKSRAFYCCLLMLFCGIFVQVNLKAQIDSIDLAVVQAMDTLSISDYPDTIYSEYVKSSQVSFTGALPFYYEIKTQSAVFDTVPEMMLIKPGYRGNKVPIYKAVQDTLEIVEAYWAYSVQACTKVKVEKWLSKNIIKYYWIKQESLGEECSAEAPTDSCHWRQASYGKADFFYYSYEICQSEFTLDSTYIKGRKYGYTRYEIESYKENPTGEPVEVKSKHMLLNTYPLKRKSKYWREKVNVAVTKEMFEQETLLEKVTPFNYWEKVGNK